MPRKNRHLGRRHIAHFATGGLSHFLRLLGNTIIFGRYEASYISVVTEYHQPLAQLPFDNIFELSGPLLPLGSYKRQYTHRDPLMFRPSRPSGDSAIPNVHSLAKLVFESAYLPVENYRGGEFTTGDWPPGFSQEPKHEEAWLASLDSLSLRPQFVEKIKSRKDVLDGPYLGVHFRNTDYSSNLNQTIEEVERLCIKNGLDTVYWCTDDASSIDYVESQLSNFKVLHDQPFSSTGKKNLHYSMSGEGALHHLENTFADLWTLASSTMFLPTSGSWKSFVPLLRNEKIASNFFNCELLRM